MTPRRILVVYGTRYGQTAKIARYVTDLLTASGHIVTIATGDALPAGFTPADYDAIVAGASVIAGRHQRYMDRWARTWRDYLNAMPSAFFSVSGAAASADEAGRAEARRLADGFLRETGWTPRLVETIGGAMAFTKYPWFVRWMMRRISRRAGGPVDTSRDHEMTDWRQVERFATRIGGLFPAPAERAPAAAAGTPPVTPV